MWTAGLGGDSETSAPRAAADGRGRTCVRRFARRRSRRAVAADTGNALWTAKTKLALSAGPEVDGGLVVLGSSDGDVIALDASNGSERWRKSIGSEVLARPLIANDVVVDAHGRRSRRRHVGRATARSAGRSTSKCRV